MYSSAMPAKMGMNNILAHQTPEDWQWAKQRKDNDGKQDERQQESRAATRMFPRKFRNRFGCQFRAGFKGIDGFMFRAVIHEQDASHPA